MAKLGTGTARINQFGDPATTIYHATPEDWEAWKALKAQYEAIRGNAALTPSQKVVEMQKLGAENERIRNKYGGMDPQPPKAAPEPAAPPAPTAPAAPAAHPAATIAASVEGWQFDGEKGGYTIGKVTVPKQWSFTRTVEGQKTTLLINADTPPAEIQARLNAKAAEFKTEPAAPAAAAAPTAPEREWLGKPLSYWDTLTDPANLPKGDERARLAKSLGVPNMPGKIVQHIKRRVAEIRAKPEAPPAPPEPVRPAEAPPMTRADAERIVKEVEARRQKVIDWMRKAQDVQDKLEMGKELTDEELTFAKGHIEGEDEGPEPNTYEQLAEYKRALAVLGRPDQFTPPPGAPPAPTPPSQLLFVKSGNRMRQVSAKEASAMMDRIRAETGKGASELGRLILYNSKGNPIGHVSYNGNVWYGTGANPDLIHNATGLVKDAQGRWGIPEGPRWKELTEVQDKLDQFRKKHAAFSDASLAADYPEFAALIKQRDAILKERHGAGAGGTIDVTAQAKPIEPPPPAAPAEAPPPVTPPPAALPSPAKPAAAAPAAQTATARIANIFNRWDQGDESVTERDVLKQVEDEIAAGEKLPKPLVKAAQKYRAALQEDIAMAGRGEVEPAQEAFMSQVEKLAPAEPVTAAKLQSEVTKVANTEGQRPAKEVKSELVQRVEAEIAALPELKGEVEFGKPRSYEGVKKIKVLKIGEPGNGTLEIVEGRSGLWKVVVSDYFAGVKTPIYRSQVLQSDMPLAEAKEYAREQMLSGNPFHVDKPVLEGEKLKKEITVDWSKWPTDEHPIRQAPDTVTIDIPGDGTFTVPKTRFALERMLKRAKALDTKPGETKAEEQRLAKQRGTPPAEPGISVGPGAASPAEFAERPDPEVMGINIGSPVWNKITRGWRNLIEGIRQLHSRSGQKQDIMMMANEAHNLPYMTGQQAGNSLRLRTKPEERTALTFLMQSLKMSGQGLGAEAEARLGLLEHAGDPIGYLRAKQTDLETAAQDFNRRGLKLEAQAAIEAAKAMRYARQNFNRLKSLADLAKRKFDLQLRREDRAGIHTDYENWYVPQRHELDLFTSGDRPIILGHSRAGGIGTNFKKAKVFEDYASAIEAGFVPRSLDIGDLLEHRVTQGERIIARKTFYDGMRTITDPVDGKPVVISIPKRKVTRPDGTVETQESVPLDYAAHEVIPGYRVAVHKGYDRLVNALTARSQLAESAAVGLLQDIAAVEKHIGLALDTFHASRTLQAEAAITGKLSLGARQRLGRALVEYNLADLDAAVAKGEITQEMADYIQTRQPMQIHGRTVNVSPSAVLRFGARNGLNVGRFADALYRQFLRDFPITGTVNKWVFDKMTRSAISHSFIAEFERVGKARPDLTAQQVARTVARDINVLFGNLQKESIFRNPSLRSIMQILFLAPQWVEALTRREARTVLQLGKLPIDVMRGRPVHLPTTAKAVGTGLAAYVVATQVANLITRGQLTFFNPEEGHKLDAWIPGGPRGFFISPLSVFGEITHDVIRYAQTKPDIATALQQIGANKLGNLGRFLDIAVLGRDPLSGEKIIGTARRAVRAAIAAVPVPITLSQGLRAGAAAATGGAVPAPPPGAVQRQIMSSAGFKTEPVPSAQTRIYQLVDRWKMQAGPKYRAEVERRQKEDFGPSDYGPLRQALAAGRLNAARDAYRDLRNQGKTPRTIDQTISKPHPFTGSRVAEAAFMQTLTPEQREIYRQALEERKQLLQQFRQMQSTR